MTNNFHFLKTIQKATLLAGVICSATLAAQAQSFDYISASSGKGALLAGFRKPGSESFELVVKLPNITNLLAMAAGSTVSINNYGAAQLSAAYSTFPGIQWSVFGTFTDGPNVSWNGFAANTLWFTLPRSSVGTQTTPPTRLSGPAQGNIRSEIDSAGKGGRNISIALGSTNSNNNAGVIREPVPDASSLGTFIGDGADNTIGDFHSLPTTIENIVPSPFSAAIRSDLYQSVPDGSGDPNSGTSTGNAYFVGFFTLNTDGTMSFTRSSTVVAAQAPTPLITSITRVGTTSTVFFTTTNGAFIYSLRFTNVSGLTAPSTNWPLSVNTTVGNGSIKSLTDVTTSSNRFYRISAQ